MALSDTEKLLLEAVKSMLSGEAKLGLAVHKGEQSIKDDSNTFQFLHENIEEQFGLETLDLTHHNGICAAFHKVHSYKYATDPTFYEALKKEFKAQAIPEDQQEKAFVAYDKIINEIRGDRQRWAEKDAGWHPDLAGVIEASQPQQFED